MANQPLDKLNGLERRFSAVEAELAAGPPAAVFVRLSKVFAELEPVVWFILA